MQRNGWNLRAAALVVTACVTCASADAAEKPNFLPTPKVVKMAGGEMQLTAATRIVATEPKLRPIAEIFSRELLALTAIRMAVVVEGEPAAGEPEAMAKPGEPEAMAKPGEPEAMAKPGEPRRSLQAEPGDIVLRINPKLRADNDIVAVQNRQVVKTRDYAHTIKVADTCVVEGWDYRAVCEGTATLLQAVKARDGKASLPKMEIKDWPFADYVGWMFDCARQDVPIHALRSIVESMRFWKCRYLHLHLSDESAFMFPLQKWPEASKFNGAINNGDPGKVWDRAELIKLVEFADQCGVTIVPELETPGHCGGYQAALGDKLGDCNYRMMDIANDSIYPNLEVIINEMCDVFRSTPFFHIGGDEIELDRLKNAPHVKEYLKAHGMREVDKGGMDDLLKQHVLRLNEFIKKRGKKTLYWGGYQGPPQDPEMSDCIVYSWYRGARQALDNGLTIITVPWDIIVPWEKWNIYSSNQDTLKRTDSVLGGCRVAWECSAEAYVIGTMFEGFFQEGKWAVDSTATTDMKGIRAREAACADQLRKIVTPVQFKCEGAVTNPPSGFEGFEYQDTLKVTLVAKVPDGCAIRYTTDGTAPGVKSPFYSEPLQLTGGLRLRAAMFDKDGELVGGYSFAPKYHWKGFEQNLTTGKPVRFSGPTNNTDKAEYAADGWVSIDKYWGSIPAPQWWQVDLEKEYNLDRVRIFPYWDGLRYYHYTIEVSTDGTTWAQVVDATKNSTPETDQGRMHQFAPTKGRYIRVSMLKNSDNPAVHLVEVRAYEASK